MERLEQVIQDIQAIRNTLDLIEIRGTYENCNRLLGIHQVLMRDMETLRKTADEMKAKQDEKKEDHGNDEHGNV